MSRAYVFYILAFGLLIGGLWVILTMGTAIKAPDDLSGRWTVAWDAPPVTAGEHVNVMDIAQSGRYFTVRLGERESITLMLDEGWRGARDGRVLTMRLKGEVWTMEINADIPMNSPLKVPEAHVTLRGGGGGTVHTGLARRELARSASAGSAAGAGNPAAGAVPARFSPAPAAETVHAR